MWDPAMGELEVEPGRQRRGGFEHWVNGRSFSMQSLLRGGGDGGAEAGCWLDMHIVMLGVGRRTGGTAR